MQATLLIQALIAAIGAAPQAIELIEKIKVLAVALFTEKLISKDQQAAVFAYADAAMALHKAGVVPPAWTVEPDPQ